jgi:hypothetical protein
MGSESRGIDPLKLRNPKFPTMFPKGRRPGRLPHSIRSFWFVEQRQQSPSEGVHLKGNNETIFAVADALSGPDASDHGQTEPTVVDQLDRKATTDPPRQSGNLADPQQGTDFAPLPLHEDLNEVRTETAALRLSERRTERSARDQTQTGLWDYPDNLDHRSEEQLEVLVAVGVTRIDHPRTEG